MSPPIRDGSGDSIGAIRLGDGSEISEVRTGAGDVLFASGIPDSALTQDLVAWYRFEDGDARDYTNDLDATFADTTAYDGTVNGATYQSSGGVTDFENGANSGAFDFDGSSDFIEPPRIPFSSNTKMCWFNRDNVGDPDLQTVFGAKDSPETQYTHIAIEGGDVLYRFDDTNISADKIIAEPISSNEWNHVAITYDSTSSSSNCGMFLNGVSVGSASKDGGFSFNSRENIGANVSGSIEFFDGTVDDCRIYNRVLTASEISDIYNATKP